MFEAERTCVGDIGETSTLFSRTFDGAISSSRSLLGIVARRPTGRGISDRPVRSTELRNLGVGERSAAVSTKLAVEAAGLDIVLPKSPLRFLRSPMRRSSEELRPILPEAEEILAWSPFERLVLTVVNCSNWSGAIERSDTDALEPDDGGGARPPKSSLLSLIHI